MCDSDQTPAPAVPLSAPESSPLTELVELIRTGRIPNALLFTGAQGTGKYAASLLMAKACNCSSTADRPCNACPSCKKLNAGMHPDFIRIDPEADKKNISIAQIRETGRRISARPNEARFRLVVIPRAGLMNVQAQNALLKVLEEPPDQTFFILNADHRSDLLPTILSRCRHFRFSAIPEQKIRQVLEKEHGISSQMARIAVSTLGPDPDLLARCLGLTESGSYDWPSARQWLICRVTDLMTGRGNAATGMVLSRHLCEIQENLGAAMAVIRTLIRDLVIFKYSPEKIVNLDFFSTFEDISQVHRQPTFLIWMSAFLETQRRLESNSGMRLTLDRFFLKLAGHKAMGLTRILS